MKRQADKCFERLGGQIIRTIILAVVYCAGIVAFWWVAIRLLRVPRYLVPSPEEVFASLYRSPAYYTKHFGVTFAEATLGLIWGFSAGLILGALIRYGSLIGRLLAPLVLGRTDVSNVRARAPLHHLFRIRASPQDRDLWAHCFPACGDTHLARIEMHSKGCHAHNACYGRIRFPKVLVCRSRVRQTARSCRLASKRPARCHRCSSGRVFRRRWQRACLLHPDFVGRDVPGKSVRMLNPARPNGWDFLRDCCTDRHANIRVVSRWPLLRKEVYV